MIEKMLPLTAAPTVTYQGTSFVLSILLSYENTKNAYFNNYINIQCNGTHNSYDINLNFTGVTWEDYRVKGIAEMNLYYLKNIHKDTFVEFIKERIDQENYLLFYTVDEYYLSYSRHYQNKHNLHDTYVYGYNSDSFCIVAYKGEKLTRLNVPMLELLRALYCQDRTSDHLSFCTFRPNQRVKEMINLKMIKQSLWDYFQSEYFGNKSPSIIYGISTYNALIDCVKEAISSYALDISHMDLRPFRLFWEHKKVLKDHISKISEIILVDCSMNGLIDEIEMQAGIILNLMIKYKLNNNVLILEKVVAYLVQLKEKEEKLICLLLDVLGN